MASHVEESLTHWEKFAEDVPRKRRARQIIQMVNAINHRRSDVISIGDVFSPDRYPQVDLEKGGSINGVVAALNHILKLTVPEVNQEGGTMIIPGHGHLCDEADVAEYRDMVTIVRDRVQDLVKKGMSLEQVKAARLTRDYDPVYGTPQYTGEMFVEAVYRSLSKSGTAR